MRKKHVADVVREFLEELSKLNECKYYSEEVQHLKFLIMLFVLRKYPTRYKHNCTKKKFNTHAHCRKKFMHVQ